MATGRVSTCSGRLGPRRPKAYCSARTRKELTRDKLQAVFETFPQAAIMARVYDRLQVIEFAGLDLAVCSVSSTKARW